MTTVDLIPLHPQPHHITHVHAHRKYLHA
jgi:hypothetical protein